MVDFHFLISVGPYACVLASGPQTHFTDPFYCYFAMLYAHHSTDNHKFLSIIPLADVPLRVPYQMYAIRVILLHIWSNYHLKTVT